MVSCYYQVYMQKKKGNKNKLPMESELYTTTSCTKTVTKSGKICSSEAASPPRGYSRSRGVY